MIDNTRPCDSRSRKVNRYTRTELETIVHRQRMPLSDQQMRRMSLTNLCDYIRQYPAMKKKRNEAIRKRKEEDERKRKVEEKRIMERKKMYERQRAFRQEKALIATLLAEKRKAREEKEKLAKRNCEKRSLVPLRDYQKKVVRFMKTHDRLLVYHKMGTGKTLTAVVVSQCFLDAFPRRRVVVVSPASLLDNFKKAMREYGDVRHASKYEFYSIQKCTSLLKKGELDCKNKLVIIDEVHNYKANVRRGKHGEIISGKNVFHGYQCFLRAAKLLLLTGTPLYNNILDTNVYKVLLNYNPTTMNSLPLFDVIESFKKEPLDILKCKISYHSFEKNDEDFPKRINKLVRIIMKPEYEKQYRNILSEISNDSEKKLLPRVFENYSESNENQFFNLTRRATQNIDNDLELNRKLQYVKHLVAKYEKRNKHLSPEDQYKIVIYSQFKDHGIHLIQNVLHVPYATISGDTKVKERAHLVQQYNEGKITVLFLTKAGGEGLDLKGTDAIVVMEPTWNDNSTEQVVARAIRYRSHEHRDGGRRKVKVYRLCHVTEEDVNPTSKTFIRNYLRRATTKFPRASELMNHLISCDWIMEIYQRAKQKQLARFEKELEKLSIENNPCE